MLTKRIIVSLTALIVLAAFALVLADETKEEKATKASKPTWGVEGTWRLVSGTLADGTVLKPPDINGLLTFYNGYRNFNVVSRNPNGLVFTHSVISKYKLTDSTWTETLIYSSTHDEIHGQPVKYDFEGKTVTVPIKKEGAKVTIEMPFDPPTVVFEGDKLTATLEGQFVDVWERVK